MSGPAPDVDGLIDALCKRADEEGMGDMPSWWFVLFAGSIKTVVRPLLDALTAERDASEDAATTAEDRLAECEPLADALREVAASNGGYATEIAGVRIEKCDEYGSTATTRRAEKAGDHLTALRNQIGVEWGNGNITDEAAERLTALGGADR